MLVTYTIHVLGYSALPNNAIKFTDQGEVRIAFRLTDDNGQARLRFDVIDTGIGMNEEQLGGLFQAFTQVDNSSARKFGGTGLGLCISKRLTEAMGGKIEVRSTLGKGSTFSVTIDPGPLDGIRMIRNTERPCSNARRRQSRQPSTRSNSPAAFSWPKMARQPTSDRFRAEEGRRRGDVGREGQLALRRGKGRTRGMAHRSM